MLTPSSLHPGSKARVIGMHTAPTWMHSLVSSLLCEGEECGFRFDQGQWHSIRVTRGHGQVQCLLVRGGADGCRVPGGQGYDVVRE